MKKRYLLFAVVLLYCAWAVSPAYAHAVFLRSNPAPNAVLAQSPAQVVIYFSETIQPGLSSISVYDSGGLVMDLGDVRVDPSDATRMTVSLRSLADGIYTVTWKAISATDGHFTTGSFPFAVGNVNSAALAAVQQTSSSSLPISALISKWLLLAALALLTGQVSFSALVWYPALKASENEFPPEVRRPPAWAKIYQFGWIAVLIGLGLSLLSEAGQSNGNELAWPWAPETGLVLTTTRLGVIWLVRLALAVIGIWLTQNRAVPSQHRDYLATWKRPAGFATCLALLLTVSLTSHAATERYPALPVLADWLHLVGMSFWFGGLAYLLTGLRELQRATGTLRTRLTSLAVTRFSVMAIISVGVIGVTGLYAAYLRVGTLDAFDTTIYGHVLFIKQGFVAALLLLAAVNLFFISPRLNRDRLGNASNVPLVMHLEKIVQGEVILACLLLLLVSVLTYLPPAKITPPSTDLTGSSTADDLQIDLTISPGYVGQNTFTVNVTSNGQPVTSVKEALLRFTASQGNIPPSDVQLIGQGDGTYVTKGSYLSLPSNWQVQAIVRRDNKFDEYANFNFTVNNPGANNQDAATPRFAGGLTVLVGLLFGFFMLTMTNKPALHPGAGGVLLSDEARIVQHDLQILRLGVAGLLSLLLVVPGLIYLTRPIASTNSQANPILPDARSIAAGQVLYSTYCVLCHGVFGKGDGPVGLTLNPRPADLSYHAILGVHTDAQLFEWITNGFPGSRMPAWKSVISDTDRWNLVNFIRTLAPK